MKNLYPKSKFKVHPSPSPPSDALSVLNLLPPAIFTLTAALAFEDKEVVAYLMIRSLYGLGPTEAEERRRCRRTAAGAHRPAFDCGCFDCYTWFWSRWDCSSDRDVIHLVVEGFEEHLAMKEMRGREARRKRKKREKEEKMVEVEAAEENKGFEEEEEEEAVTLSEERENDEKEESLEVNEEGEEVVEIPAVIGDKRRGLSDLMGIFNLRLLSLWSPGA